MKTSLGILAVASFISLPLLADFASGLAAYQKGDYAAAYHEWLPMAEKGSPDAQFNLGLMYVDGKGVPQDYTQAANWFLRAAEQGQIEAQHNLGAMYGVGRGVKRDYVQAYKWLNICASQGNKGCAAQRDLVGKKLSAGKLAEAQRLSSAWSPRVADDK